MPVMKMFWRGFYACVVYLCIVLNNCAPVESSKLNLPRVLLPLFNDFSSNFTLEAVEGGCFKWRTSRLDVIQLIPVDQDPELGCSSKAILSTISKESTRNTVIVFAEEISSGQLLRCDVIVDVISALNIVTTTRELFMEEAPELFEVRAYDDQGNEFTSLEGVEFHWAIGSWNDHLQASHGNSVLRFITFRDSPYETPPTIAKFDVSGLRGHIILLEGIKTGSAKVSVQLPHSEYRHVSPIEVQLIVVANLLIDPPDAYIMKGDTIKYKLLQVQHGKLEEIRLPSSQYFLEVEEPVFAVTDKHSSLVRGLEVGKTKVILRDRNVDNSESGAVRLPTATLTVTTPAYLTLTLLPHRNWAVLVNQLSTILIEVFDSDNHKLSVGESSSLVTDIPQELFELTDMTRNGSYLTGIPLKPGTAPVVSRFESVGGVKLKPVISAQADLEIYPRLAVKPSEVVLPWYPHVTTTSKHEAKLKATGGDGVYMWTSVNTTVAVVTQSGLVRAQNQGQTEIMVAMLRNQHNRETAKVHVLPPGHMEIVEYVLEAEVGSPIFVHVAMYAYKPVFGKLKKIPFTRCQDLPFKVEVFEKEFYYNASAVGTPVGIACATVAIIGRAVGTTKVTVSYTQEDINIESSTVVAAYEPLDVVQPTTAETVLAVGSSRHVVWSGGPKPWLGRNFEHSHHADFDESIVDVQELFTDQRGQYIFNILCRSVGESDVTLNVENKPALINCKSAVSVSTVKVFCAKPRFISLSVRAIGTLCPINMNTDRVVAHCGRPLTLLITIKDDRGRIFDNATSLKADWKFSKPLAMISGQGLILLEEKEENNYVIPLDHYQVLIPNNETGILKINTVLSGYRTDLMSNLKITPESPPFSVISDRGQHITPVIETSLIVVFVNDTIITPNRTTVFNHPTNKVTLKVTEGSGHYNVMLNTPDVATAVYFESTRTLEVTPKNDGNLKIALVDLCLPTKPAVVDIQVLKVGTIKVEMIDRIEKGQCVTAHVHLYDSMDNPLNIMDVELLELRPYLEHDIISLKPIGSPVTDSTTGKREVKYLVTGLQLGETKLTFVSGRGVNEIQSAPVSVQVFPPLRLVPRNVTLTIGSVFQLKAIGGPQPDSTMEYFSTDQSIAKISNIGLIETSRLGDILVTGMAVGVNKATGHKIVFCKDTIEVHVIPLDGIKIHTPLVKLKVGARIPVWAGGIPDQLTPLILGAVQPNLLFKWQVSSPDVVELRDVFFTTGIEVPEKDRLSMRVKALKPGRATLHLNVTVKGAIVKCPDKSTVILSDFIEIEVFEELRLLKPDFGPTAFKPLLLAPDTLFQLVTNKDGVDQISYSVLGYPFTVSGSVSSSYNNEITKSTAVSKQETILSVDGHGLISTGSTGGRALVLLRSDKDFTLDQTIGLNVEVKQVFYLMMNVNAKLRVDPKTDRAITALPRGLDLELVISYHDNTGAEFAATRTDIRMRTNRFDKVHVTRGNVNGSVLASLVGSGETVLKMWDQAIPYHSEDYIKFSVQHLMFPDKAQLVVGDIICFSMPLLSENGEIGVWTSADRDVLVMERREGVGRATGKTGSALVTYRLSNAITATTAMQVLPISVITFLPLDGRNVSNNNQADDFLVPLILSNDQLTSSVERTRNMLAKDNKCHIKDFDVQYFPFSCEVRFNSLMTSIDINEVFVVTPHFSIDTGFYSCRFKSITTSSANVSVLQSNITLRAVSGRVMSDPLVIPFLPAVFVHTPEVHLSDKHPSAFLTVTGVPQVLSQIQLISKDSVLVLNSVEHTTLTSLSYSVKLKQRFWATLSTREHHLTINLISSLTSQHIEIPVVVHMKGEGWFDAPCFGAPSNNYLLNALDDDNSYITYNNFTVFVSIAVISALFYYGYYCLMRCTSVNDPSARHYVPNVQVRSIFKAGSPIISSPPAFSSSSSVTPDLSMSSSFMTRQPFSDMEPVYGDPNLSHHSPEAKRRTRRLK